MSKLKSPVPKLAGKPSAKKPTTKTKKPGDYNALVQKRLAVILPPNIVLPPTAYEEEHFWGRRTHVPLTPETPKVMACCNEHRNTCLRVMVGRKKTAYVPMEASGLHVVRTSHEAFTREWSGLVEYTPQQMAQKYLSSRAASYYISEEARTLLEEIAKTGATSSTNFKENDMSTTKPSSSKKTTAAAKVKGSTTPPKKAAAPTKPKNGKATKPTYAGQTIKALFKVEEVMAREGTWTRFMIVSALKSANAEAAQKKVDDSKEFAGRKMDFGWLIAKGYISMK